MRNTIQRTLLVLVIGCALAVWFSYGRTGTHGLPSMTPDIAPIVRVAPTGEVAARPTPTPLPQPANGP